MLDADNGRSEHGALLNEIVESDAWLGFVWESAPDAMVLSDADRIVFLANSAYCELYGYEADELVGRTFATIFPPEKRARPRSSIGPSSADLWTRRCLRRRSVARTGPSGSPSRAPR